MEERKHLPEDRECNIVARSRQRCHRDAKASWFGLVAVALLFIPATVLAAIDIIPHGSVARSGEGSAGITAAWFFDPTSRYPHGVLGDTIEGGALAVIDDAGVEHRVVLPVDRVFEDLTPRIADVTGNGRNDVVVVESQIDKGASLAIYSLDGDGLRKTAATPHIGLPNRWLAPAGIADFNDDGVVDVAYVETPHIGGTLRVWSFRGGGARQLSSAPGFSNHRIGDPFISGGLRDCGAGAELVLPEFGWRRTLIVQVSGNDVISSVYAADASTEALNNALTCR